MPARVPGPMGWWLRWCENRGEGIGPDEHVLQQIGLVKLVHAENGVGSLGFPQPPRVSTSRYVKLLAASR